MDVMGKTYLRYIPVFCASMSIALSALDYAAHSFMGVAHVFARHLDAIELPDFLFALTGAVLGVVFLQRRSKDTVLKFGTLLSVLALLLSTFGLPL